MVHTPQRRDCKATGLLRFSPLCFVSKLKSRFCSSRAAHVDSSRASRPRPRGSVQPRQREPARRAAVESAARRDRDERPQHPRSGGRRVCMRVASTVHCQTQTKTSRPTASATHAVSPPSHSTPFDGEAPSLVFGEMNLQVSPRPKPPKTLTTRPPNAVPRSQPRPSPRGPELEPLLAPALALGSSPQPSPTLAGAGR